MGILRKWELEKDQRHRCIEIIQSHAEQSDSPIGALVARDMIDEIMNVVGPLMHDKGIEAAKKLIIERMHDIEVDLDLLNQA